MDFQKIADSYYPMTCIVSVEKTRDGGYGMIRITAGNQKFTDMIARQTDTPGTAADQTGKIITDAPYETYFPKDPHFEDICCRAAILKESVHTYVHPNVLNQWFNIFAMPIDYEEEDFAYCIYIMKPTEISDMDLSSSHATSISDDVLKTCIKLHGTEDFQKTMDEVIRDTRILCGAEVCTIMLMEFTTGTVSILAKSVWEHCKLKTVTQFVNFYDIANSWLATIGDSDCLIIKNERDMEYIREINYPWWLTLDEAGVDSVVMFPLRYDHEVLGFIWATNFDTRNTLRIKETLELTTFFLSSQIASYKMMQRLERIGYMDMLTGVNNRNAMNNRVSAIVDGSEPADKPYGVVFADLNGLKTVNDAHGHNAGDLLLKKAAILLQELFDGNAIYRAGGDEFVVLLTGCTREELEQKVRQLRERSDTPENVCFAVGSYYAEPGFDIRDAMRLADENMYKDKKAFYRAHPESDRRIQDRKD